MKTYYVYILTNKSNTAIYIGLTSDLSLRLQNHQMQTSLKSFTSRYNVNKLVYFEKYDSLEFAKGREHQLKNWHRDWKLNLVKQNNPEFRDLRFEIE